MTHSLNDENGISSACEYDINSVIGKVIMTNLSGKAPYMGNTNAIVFDKRRPYDSIPQVQMTIPLKILQIRQTFI